MSEEKAIVEIDDTDANTDPELRAAAVAYLRGWESREGKPFFPQHMLSEGSFEQLVDKMLGKDGVFAQMLRRHRDRLGRYPTFEEVDPPSHG